VASLIMHERLEMDTKRAFRVREYTERLISEAVLHGDRHKETMEIAKFWCHSDPGAVHKLFQVLVPRFSEHTRSYTRMLAAPKTIIQDFSKINGLGALQAFKNGLWIVELKGHPYPPLSYSNTQPNKNAIHNVLLSEAAKDYRSNKKS